MNNNIYKILKTIAKKLVSLFMNHKVRDMGIDKNDIQYSSFPVIDLSRNFYLKKKNAVLCSYEGDSTFSYSDEYPIIESWVKVKNTSYTINNFFLYEQYRKIKATDEKKIKKINKEIFLLPYYTSHFGHFTGDLLGQILYYLTNVSEINKKKKLLVITPSQKWDDFLEYFATDNIKLLKPKEALSINYSFSKAKILPRMSSLQNYLLAKNILNTVICKNRSSPKKVFLTTGREDRIANIKELNEKLQNLGFAIIIPSNYKITDLLNIIKSAELLITEKASILNNVHLIRDRKYFLLSSKTERILDMKLFIGAGIYKEFNRGLAKEIYCEDDPINQNVRAFKKRIKVNINNLLSIIKNEIN
jgi:hypothetical protein